LTPFSLQSALIVIGSLLLSSCVTMPVNEVEIRESFDRVAAAKALQPGPNTIAGSALVRQQGGGVVTCAGNTVFLIPATSYARTRMAHIYGSAGWAANDSGRTAVRHVSQGGLSFKNEPPDYLALNRQTTCNAQGFFRFESVADGEFFVMTVVTWTVARAAQGGALVNRVTVVGGQVLEVVLAP
jgi:hypothetical protein